jgi:hypothetical protein
MAKKAKPAPALSCKGRCIFVFIGRRWRKCYQDCPVHGQCKAPRVPNPRPPHGTILIRQCRPKKR